MINLWVDETQLIKREKVNILGKHSDPNEKSAGKYIVVGLATVLLAGGLYFGATRLLNKPAEEPQKTLTAKESQTKKAETSTKQSTKKAAKQSSQSTTASSTKQAKKQSTKQSSSSQVPASSKKKSKKSSQSKPKAVKLDTTALTKSAGKVYYGVHYFNTNQDFSSNNSEPTSAANIIELFIMDYALAQDGTDQLINDQTLADWLKPMIQQNDLNATNVLIDHYGIDQLNAYFKEQGYTDTRIERRMVDINVRITAEDNYTSLNDCLKLLKKIYDGREKEPQKTMLDLLKGQVIRTKIPAKLPKDVTVANITGEQQNVENDIGIVLTKDQPFALVVLTKDVSGIVKTRTAIADFSLAASKWK